MAKIFAIVLFIIGSGLRGYFNDSWFGNAFGFLFLAFAFMVWSHYEKMFWPANGLQGWEEKKRAGFLKHLTSGIWLKWSLRMAIVMGPVLYLFHLLVDGPSKTASFYTHIYLAFSIFITVGILLDIWVWVDCQLHASKERKLIR